MTGKLEGKIAIVTDAGSIGPGRGNDKATAVAFADFGLTAREFALSHRRE